jgi:hypothetical protein
MVKLAYPKECFVTADFLMPLVREDNAGRRLRRLRAQMDTGDPESAKLSSQSVSLNALGQGWHRRQDA